MWICALNIAGIVLRCPLRMSQSAYIGNAIDSAAINTTVVRVIATGDTGITYSIPNSAMISDLFSVTPSGEIIVSSNLRSDDRVLYEFEVEATSDECSVRAGVTVRVLRNQQPPQIGGQYANFNFIISTLQQDQNLNEINMQFSNIYCNSQSHGNEIKANFDFRISTYLLSLIDL